MRSVLSLTSRHTCLLRRAAAGRRAGRVSTRPCGSARYAVIVLVVIHVVIASPDITQTRRDRPCGSARCVASSLLSSVSRSPRRNRRWHQKRHAVILVRQIIYLVARAPCVCLVFRCPLRETFLCVRRSCMDGRRAARSLGRRSSDGAAASTATSSARRGSRLRLVQCSGVAHM